MTMLREESDSRTDVEDSEETEEERWLRCASCEAAITRVDERISDAVGLGIHGGAFVNPHGYLHELEPFLSAPGAREIGPSRRADSWFPGYTWAMAHCSCGAHLGWCFRAIEGRKPACFWGLRTASLIG
jgi:cereblon